MAKLALSDGSEIIIVEGNKRQRSEKSISAMARQGISQHACAARISRRPHRRPPAA